MQSTVKRLFKLNQSNQDESKTWLLEKFLTTFWTEKENTSLSWKKKCRQAEKQVLKRINQSIKEKSGQTENGRVTSRKIS